MAEAPLRGTETKNNGRCALVCEHIAEERNI